MSALFHTYLYTPIFAVLIFLYHNIAFGDLGVAIIELTVLVRLVLLPLFHKSAKDQTIMQRLQPHVRRIQIEHKDDKERQAKELMALYQEHRVNPFSGFFLLLIQIPIFIALFQMFTTGISSAEFATRGFLGLIDLAGKNYILVLVAAVLQFFQSKMMFAKQAAPAQGGQKDPTASMQKMMMYIGPILTILILGNLPAALGLYWLVSNAFSLVQQVYINKRLVIGGQRV